MEFRVSDGDYEALMARLSDNLKAAKVHVPEDELPLYQLVLEACEKTNITKFRNNLTLYLEGSFISERYKGTGAEALTFLITDDHHFFRSFFASKRAEEILIRQVKSLLDLRKSSGLKIRLAGELIHGM